MKTACNNWASMRKSYNKLICKPIHASVRELDKIEMKILDSCAARLNLNFVSLPPQLFDSAPQAGQ
jgi:hypothetical protein